MIVWKKAFIAGAVVLLLGFSKAMAQPASPSDPCGSSVFYYGSVPTVNQWLTCFNSLARAVSGVTTSGNPANGQVAIFTAPTVITGVSFGTSVQVPGTGTIESLLPIQSESGTSYVFGQPDLFQETRRSNFGSSMTDTFPASTVTGMKNGTKIVITNSDASATDVITAGAGTTISGNSTDTIEPGRAVQYVYDGVETWRKTVNTGSAALFNSLGSNTINDLVCMRSIYGGVQDCSIAKTNVVQVNQNQTFTKAQRAAVQSLSLSGATATPNFDNNQNFTLTLVHASCPCALANPSTTPVAGQAGVLEVIQSSSGSDLISTWGSDYVAAGGITSLVLSTSPNARDYIGYYVADSTHIVLSVGVANASH